MASNRSDGFTLIEMMIVMAILAIAVGAALPRMQRWLENARLRDAARSATDAMLLARSEAVRTGNNHILFFATAAGTDPCGNPLQDANGNPVPFLILDDGAPGSPLQNCCIDAGAENANAVPAILGVNWGTTFAAAAPATDPGLGPIATGSSFTDPNGVPTNWVLFRPDGLPVSFTAACVQGSVGTGGGGIYVTNGNRDYGAVLSPLGGVKLHAYERASATWF